MKYKYLRIVALVQVLFFSINSNIFSQSCTGGLDTIDQVSVLVACKDSFTILWPAHAANCYQVTVGTGINNVVANGSLTIAKDVPGISDFSKITITESCGGLILDPCTNTTSTDIFMGVVPPLDSAGLWTFQKLSMTGSGTMMTGSGTAAFSPESPTNVPDVSNDVNLTASSLNIVRPTCNGDSDGTFDIELNFLIGSLDSVMHETRRVDDSSLGQSFGSPTTLSAIESSQILNVFGTIAAGQFETKIIVYSGSCLDSITHITTVGEGSDEPVVACNSDINVQVDAECMADIHIGMILAGQSSPCVMSLMDSLVVKTPNGIVIPTINVGSGSFDTIRIQDASSLILQPLFLEVHSSGGGVSNSCWGNLLLEDKRAPVLVCDTSYVVSCFDFDATDMSNVVVMDCDLDPTINLINQEIVTDCNLLPAFPNDSIVKRVIRTFNAVDNFNNVSNTCMDTIDIKRLDSDLSNNTPTGGILDIEGLMNPLDYLVNNNPLMPNDTTAFICDTEKPFADENNDGIPDPVDFIINGEGDTLYGAGVPKIDTIINGDTIFVQFFPSNVSNPHSSVAKMLEICKTITSVRDIVLPPIGCVRKVVRTWTISEWVCNRETTLEINQTIEIQDTTGPVIEVPADMKVTTNQNNCSRNMQIPPLLSISDQCSFNGQPNKVLVRVINGIVVGGLSTEDNTYSHVDGGELNLPLGRDTVIYTAFDDCHNVTSDTIFIDVVDETAPIMICKEYVSVSLSNDSGVRLPALSVNNGSFDDCTMESLCLTRMVDISRFDELRDLNVGGVLSDGMDYVPLDSMTGVCGRIFEKSGTLNGIDYIVRDDLCSTNIEYCCADGGTQDTVVLRGIDENGNANQCMARIDIQDKRRPTLHCPPDITIDCEYDIITDSTYSIFGNLVKPGEQNTIDLPGDMVLGVESGKSLVDGVWSGNCEGQVNVVAQRVADKCSAGTIERTFTVIANGYTVSCVQTITITRADTLDIKDIQFPSDTTIHACGVASDAEPDIIGRPIISEDGCSLLGDAHSDLMVRKNNSTGDACLSIIREWTIIDWCAEPAKVISTKSQIITLKDTIAPVLSNGGVCLDTIVQASSCDNGLISLTQRGSDICTSPENLIWTVDIDLNNDGSIDQNFNITPSEENNESVATLTSSFAHGQHKAIWKLNDQCGNTVVCEQLFTVIYSISPDAICRTSMTGPVSQVSGGGSQIVVWANEYNIGSSDHACGYDIIYSFASDSFVPSKTLTCVDYNPLAGADSSIVDMDIYILAVIEIENNGVKDTLIISSSLCHSNFVLYDTHNTCLAPVLNDPDITNTNKALIAGKVKTEKGINIPTVEVLLKGTNTSESNLGAITDVDGIYAFPSMELGDSYNIVPSLDKDILNGVSTLDLVLIQKHILGLERLETPYKIIAADVNNDQSISAIDMIELRKVILNVSDHFTNNTSWRFIDQSYEFRSRRDPLKENFSEGYKIDLLEEDMNIDFVGMKIGDVNETVDITGLRVSGRTTGSMVIEDQEFSPGEAISVPIKIIGAGKIVGLQYALQYDPEILEFASFKGETIDLTSDNFGMKELSDGILTSSWNDHQGVFNSGEELFILEFKAKRSGRLSEVFTLDNKKLNSEVYSDKYESIQIGLNFERGGSMTYGEYELFQNTPNPFSDYTEISFVLPINGHGTLKLFDVNGKLLKQIDQEFEDGLNKIQVAKKVLGISSGVVFYTLESGNFKASKEMIVVE